MDQLPEDVLLIIANLLEKTSMRWINDGTLHWERDGYHDWSYKAEVLYKYPYKHQPLVSFLSTCKNIRAVRQYCKLPVQYIIQRNWRRI